MLCTILTGQPPYRGAQLPVLLRQAQACDTADAFQRLDACGADAELIALCKRCLAADPAARPADGGAVAKAVADHRAGVEQRLRRAETEKAAVAVRLAEQKKKRRVQLALAAAVVVIVSGGAAFGWWQERQTSERKQIESEKQAADIRQQLKDERLANEQRVRAANNRAALISWSEQSETALKKNDAPGAALAVAEIARRLPEGGGEDLADRIRQCRTDLDLLVALNKVDQIRWAQVDNRLPVGYAVVEQWRAAFAAAGLDLRSLPPSEAARRVSASHLRDRLVATLDLWLVVAPSADVREVLRVADPDPDGFRDAVRDAGASQDQKRVAALAEDPRALRQPPGFAAALGHDGYVPITRRRVVLKAALLSTPGDLNLLMAMGNTYLKDKSRADDQVRWFQAAVAAAPSNSAAHNNLGVALLDKGDLDGAIAAYREAIRFNPNLALAHNNLGKALSAKGDLDGAIVAYREAIRLDPKLALAHNNLGSALDDKGDLDGAIAAYREAIRLDSKLAMAHYNLGTALINKGNLDEAIAAFKEAVRLDPGFALAHNNLGIALKAKGNLDGAIAAYREAIRVDPKLALAHYNLGIALTAAGDHIGAITAYRDAIRLDPEYADAHTNLGFALVTVGKPEEAMRHFEEALRLQPDNPNFKKNLDLARKRKDERDAKRAPGPAAVGSDVLIGGVTAARVR